MVESFATRCASITKKTEISSRLEAIILEHVTEDYEDEYAVLDRPTKIIHQITKIIRLEDRDDEANVRFITSCTRNKVRTARTTKNSIRAVVPAPSRCRLYYAEGHKNVSTTSPIARKE